MKQVTICLYAIDIQPASVFASELTVELGGIPVGTLIPVFLSATIWILLFSKHRGMLMCGLIDEIKRKHFLDTHILCRLNQRLFRKPYPITSIEI